MQILDDLIATLDLDAPVKEIRQGVFHTGVLTRRCGLAATLPRDALRQQPPLIHEPGSLLFRSALELAQLAYSESILEAAIGLATINSLLKVEEECLVELNAAELILEKGAGRRVAIVGHFPFVPKVRERAKDLWVIEKNPRADDLPESEAERFLPQADVIGITGTAITNHSLEDLLRLCNPRAFVVLLGGTVPLSPVLFDYGVHALSGSLVDDPERALQCISQGANFQQIQGTRRVTLLGAGCGAEAPREVPGGVSGRTPQGG
jgi:uncharacterized protein (DUF4213/DUF364 family)